MSNQKTDELTKDEMYAALSLLAEIARLIHINEKLDQKLRQQTEVMGWLETQRIIATPETVWWRDGVETFQSRVLGLIAIEDMAKAEDGWSPR